MAITRPTTLAGRMTGLRPSTIREILKVTAQPQVISFAGGLPAPELFPVDEVREAVNAVLTELGSEALQYGESEGYRPLREWITAEMGRRGVDTETERILVTNGSQQVLDLVAKTMLEPGDVVLTETPTYLAAIQAFQVFEVEFVSVPTDEHGLIPEELPTLIERHRPKLLYTIPNFQNPTGITLSADRRERVAAIAAERGLLVVEDDPYGKLRYRGDEIPPLKHWDVTGNVVYASTFSKTIAPGLRVGWLVAPAELFIPLLILKQASDLHTSSLDQRIVHRYLTGFDQTEHLEWIRHAYGERFGILDAALDRELPAGYRWTSPDGGMFLWVTAPETVDTLALLERAVERDVAFVPGRDFFPTGGGNNFFRLNFSNSTPERIREGVARLGALCREL
ncbi:MAG: PLP-dependent aminotransferase family protein [Gaiellales bacterium]